MSSISTDSGISDPRHNHVWRADNGKIHATVRLSDENISTLYFDSAADARAVAAACTAAAEAMDALPPEVTEEDHG